MPYRTIGHIKRRPWYRCGSVHDEDRPRNDAVECCGENGRGDSAADQTHHPLPTTHYSRPQAHRPQLEAVGLTLEGVGCGFWVLGSGFSDALIGVAIRQSGAPAFIAYVAPRGPHGLMPPQRGAAYPQDGTRISRILHTTLYYSCLIASRSPTSLRAQNGLSCMALKILRWLKALRNDALT